MKSIANQLREIDFDQSSPFLFKVIEKFEAEHYKLKK